MVISQMRIYISTTARNLKCHEAVKDQGPAAASSSGMATVRTVLEWKGTYSEVVHSKIYHGDRLTQAEVYILFNYTIYIDSEPLSSYVVDIWQEKYVVFSHKFRETEIKKGLYIVVMFYAVVWFMT
jgi:hypothetical protein